MPAFNVSQSQSTGGSRGKSTSRTAIVPGMMQVYSQLLNKNVENYGNILSGYQTAQQNLGQQLQQAYGGYNTLQGQVTDILQGQGQAGYEMNRRAAAQTQGMTQQRMVNAGLGNSSVLAAMSNQNMLNYNLSNNALREQLAQQQAGYMSQIGLARQGAQMQGAGLASGLAGQYLGNLAGYHFANTAGSLTGSFGQSSQSSNQQSTSNSYGLSMENPMGGGRGGGGMGPIPGEPYPQRGGGMSLAGTGYGDISSGMGGLYSPGYSPSGYQPGAATTNFNITPTPESSGFNYGAGAGNSGLPAWGVGSGQAVGGVFL